LELAKRSIWSVLGSVNHGARGRAPSPTPVHDECAHGLPPPESLEKPDFEVILTHEIYEDRVRRRRPHGC
jgi:hypothetical protein